MTVVTLADFTPPPRSDGVAWAQARIEEAVLPDGPWTTIDTLALAPLDTDPLHPAARTLTTVHATIPDGWYRVTYIDGAAHESSPTAPVENVGAELDGLRPTITDVAALLRARTKVPGGAEAGTFTGQTRPTAEEVDRLIDEARDEVLGKVVVPAPGSATERRTQGAIRLYAAMLVELSYFPEQVRSDRSPYTAYERLYKSRIDALIAESETGTPQGTGEGGPGGGGSAGDASWYFPDDAGGLVGWQSRW